MKVLAIDDDLDFQNLLKVKLTAPDFDLTIVSEPETFLSHLRKGNFDILLIDLSLGAHPLKGLELVSQVRELFPTLPIVVLSGNTSQKVIANALELGANEFQIKPADFKSLQLKMKELVRGHEVYEQNQISSEALTLNKSFLLSVKLNLKTVTETGFITVGETYVAKGAQVRFSSPLIKEIYGVDEIEGHANGFEVQKDGTYLTNFEISPEKKDLAIAVKKWLSDQLIM